MLSQANTKVYNLEAMDEGELVAKVCVGGWVLLWCYPTSDDAIMATQVRKEKSQGFTKMMELFEFMRDVATNRSTWTSDEQNMMNIVRKRSENIIEAFTPDIGMQDKTERTGKISVIVQTVLARVLGF